MDLVDTEVEKIKKEAKGKEIVRFRSAIENREVSFPHIVECHFGRLEKFQSDPVQRYLYERYYPKLLEIFIEKNGPFRHSIMHDSQYGFGAARTADNHLFASYGDVSNKTLEIIHRVSTYSYETHRLLEGKDLETCIGRLFSVISNFIVIIPGSIEEQESEEFLSVIDGVNKQLEIFSNQKKNVLNDVQK